ncbi:hypothetical protein JHK86_006245 [Glycine max]|nr:hypothetical protein JHK86_006245 [Glycine max]
MDLASVVLFYGKWVADSDVIGGILKEKYREPSLITPSKFVSVYYDGRLSDQQMALLQYQRENLHFLSEEILRLQECLSKYEGIDDGSTPQGLGIRPGVMDGAISISAIQCLKPLLLLLAIGAYLLFEKNCFAFQKHNRTEVDSFFTVIHTQFCVS